jgi:hypothetical protein
MGDDPIFERDADGLLHQVPADTVPGRRFHLVYRAIGVLFSAEEEAARDAEEAQAAAAAVAEQEAAERAAAAEASLTIQERLARLGVGFDELRDAILGEKK